MICHICREKTKAGNDAIDHSFDNFQRFYARHWLGGKEKISGHEYRYEELKDRGHTRLLELLPGNDDEQITCFLAEAPIDDPPRYSALSYTWGTAPGTKMVLVNNQNFLVTDNLWLALWHLRLPNRKRVIWIDAICIDQSNIKERNRVVLRMKDIYERADEVIAWLGPEGNEDALALSYIERVFDHYSRLFDRFGSQEATFQHMLVHRSWTGKREKGGPLVLHKQPLDQTSPRAVWLTIEKFLQGRTWFRRVWIMQEGTVPVRTTFYLCRQSLRADALYLVFRLLQSIPPNTFPNDIVKTAFTPHIAALTTFAHKRFELRRLEKGKRIPLLDVLSTLRNHSASDPHDKVYSALGFATDMNLPIDVDYKKPFSEMLQGVAVSFLHETSHNLRFLGHAGLLGTDHMPATWIPDWLHSNFLTPFPKEAHRPGSEDAEILFDACAINHPIWKEADLAGLGPSVEGHTLKTQGILVDFVRTASVSAGSLHDLDSIENIWYIENMHKPYTPTGETLEKAYLRTLVADLKMKNGEVVERGGSMYWRNREDSPPPPDHTDIQHMLQQICISRRFISTLKHRYIGLAPLCVEPGDAIFMLKGGEMLYLARPTLAGTYHFVGEAYIHGKMDGQVIQDFEHGQGTMQMVEFVPVLNTVLDSTMPASTIPGKPVDVKFTDRGYGIRGEEYSNPYEVMRPYFHSEIGPQMDPIILQAVEEATMACHQAGMAMTELIKKIFIEQVWAKVVEEKLLSNEEVQIGSSSSFQLAGRGFARRSYILAAIELEKERNRVQVLGQFQNVAPYKNGGVHVLDTDIIEDKDEGEWNDSKFKENQMAEDERIAKELQAQEFASVNGDIGRHPSDRGTVPNSEPDKYSGRDLFPLLNRRTGPPVRLMVAETENPCSHSYKFQSDEDGHQFLAELKQYTYSSGRERVLKRPLLFGRWATDPRKRPQVKLHTYGQPPDMWWEDEDGNVVEGPDLNKSPDNDDIARDQTAWDEDVKFGRWEGEGEADLPSEFFLVD